MVGQRGCARAEHQEGSLTRNRFGSLKIVRGAVEQGACKFARVCL